MPTATTTEPTGTMLGILRALGWPADALDADAEAALRRDGYLLIPGVIPAAALPDMRAAYDRVERFDLRADENLIDLLNKDASFQRCIESPRVLHAVGIVLGWDFIFHALHGRNPKPSVAKQALHRDWPIGAVDDGRPEPIICNTGWLLDDMTLDNGPTRLVPGSQHRPGTPQAELTDPTATHADERLITAPAGSVLVFGGKTWHSGTHNRSPAPRRTLFASYVRRGVPQIEGEVMRETLRVSVRARLGPHHLALIDA